MNQKEEKLGWGTILEYGIGAFGKSLSYGLSSGKILYYLTNVLRMHKGFLTPMLSILRLWDGVTDLIMGTLVDNTKSRLGKFRPWILLGAVTNAFVVVGMFWKPPVEGAGLMIYVMVMYLMLDVTYTMVDVGYWAMIPALTLDKQRRDAVSMSPRIFGGLSGIITMFAWQIIDGLGGREPNAGFFKYAILTSAVYLVTSIFSAIRVKERVAPPPQEKQEPYSVKKAAKVLWNNKQALAVVVIMILFNLANNLTGETSIYYFQYIFGAQPAIGDNYANWLTIYSIITGASQTLGLLGFPFFSKWFGRGRVYKLSIALPIAGYLLMNVAAIATPGSVIPFAVAGFVMSAGFGSMSVMQNVMLADAVDYGEFMTGQRNEGTIFSTLTFLSKVASSLSYFIVLTTFSVVKFAGEDSVAATPQAIGSFRFLMYMAPPLILVGTYLVYRQKFKLLPDFMQEVTGEIQRRRTENSRG